MKKLKAAVIGSGIYGEVHARAYHEDPRTELVCVWSRTEEHARRLAEKYQCGFATTLDSIVEDREISLLSVATPDYAHTEPAVRLLEAGKHVLVEKPMATSVADCLRIIEAQRKGGGKAMVNFHNRWHPPIVEAKRRVDSGELGKPMAARLVLSDRIEVATRWLSWAGRSGPEWFLLPHTVDLVVWFLGGEMPVRVFAAGQKGLLASMGIDALDVVQAQLEFEHATATLESSWVLPSAWRSIIEFSITVLGARGRLEIACDAEGVSVTTDRHATPLILDSFTERGPIAHFVDCVQRDVPPVPGLEDGLKVTTIIEGIVSSMRQGRSLARTNDRYA